MSRSPAPFWSVLLLLGCTASGAVPGYTREVTDDGRVLVTYSTGLPAVEDTLRPLFEIGRYENDSSPIFEDLRDLEVDGEGQIYALDFKAAHIRVFAPDGTPLRTIGRSGEGPGELNQANGLRLTPDGTLWVYDHGKRALLALDLDGTERRRVPSIVSGYGYRWGVMIDTAGVLWEPWSRQLTGPGHDMSATGLVEGRSLLMLKYYDPATEARDSVDLHEGSWRSYRASYGGGQMVMGLPFAGRAALAMDQRQRIWVTHADSFAVVRLNLDADTTMVLSVNDPGIPLTDADIADWRERMSGQAERLPTLIDDLMAFMPETRPAFTNAFTDDRDRLWLGRSVASDAAPRWDVFTPEGEFLTTVRGPMGISGFMTPVVRRDRIYLFAEGEAGERYVIVAELPERVRGE